jgi:hypothetical protein
MERATGLDRKAAVATLHRSRRYERVVRVKPRFVTGTQSEAIISELANVPQPSVSFLQKYIDSGR